MNTDKITQFSRMKRKEKKKQVEIKMNGTGTSYSFFLVNFFVMVSVDVYPDLKQDRPIREDYDEVFFESFLGRTV